MTIGGAQTLARRYGVVPGHKVLIASHGPLGLQLASELVTLGANVVALAERGRPQFSRAFLQAMIAAPRLVIDGATYRLAALRAKVPVLSGWELAKVFGKDRAEGAELREIKTGRTRHFEADIVAAGDGFAPQLELARLLGMPITANPATDHVRPTRDPDGRTPVAGVWIAGDQAGLVARKSHCVRAT
jgi:NADPH-dependent 2,4-dienoyl-CoA reductase/sulfur reductase-like enzyme